MTTLKIYIISRHREAINIKFGQHVILLQTFLKFFSDTKTYFKSSQWSSYIKNQSLKHLKYPQENVLACCRPSGLLQDLSFTLTLKILFFCRKMFKKFHQFSINYILKNVKSYVHRGIYRNKSKIYDGGFLKKQLTAFRH